MLWADAGTKAAVAAPVKFEELSGYPAPLKIWRVVPSLPHAHPSLMAKAGGVVLRLGGFPAPELVGLAASISQHIGDSVAAIAHSKLLAQLADQFGALRYVFVEDLPTDPDTRSALAQWEKHKPKDWPSNSASRTSAGTWRVTLTLLSQDTRSFNQSWAGSAYSFDLDDNGQLVSWSKRVSPSFQTRGSDSSSKH